MIFFQNFRMFIPKKLNETEATNKGLDLNPAQREPKAA